jgi:hypothetical protein
MASVMGDVVAGAIIGASLQVLGGGDLSVDSGGNYLKVPDVRLVE